MDKKAILLMLQSDAERISKEASDISRSVEKMKEDTINYIEALLTQVRTGAGPLLAKTPKMTRKRAATKIKSIPEDDVGEADEISDSNSSQRSLRSSRANSENLETSDAKPARMKRGASVRAANSIRKQQAEGLNTKLRRPSANDSDVPLAVRIKSERLSKRPKETTSSDEEDSRPLKQKKMDKDETRKEVTNDDTQDVVLELSHCEENQTYNSTRLTRTSVKRKLETSSEDNNATLTEKQSFYSEEPAAKKANKFKSPPQRNEKFTNTLNRISEKSTPNETPQQPKVSPRVTRSSASSASSTSAVKAAGSTKLKNHNVINETVEADETMVSMYEDAVAKPPMMNSTMNPNTTVTLERMMNVTVLLDPIPNKVCDETVTIHKAPPKKKLSSSEIKEMAQRRSSKASKQVGSGTKTQQTLRLEQFNEIMTDDESSPERKGYRLKKNQQAPPPKRQTRSSQMFESSDSEVEVKKTPLKILPSKDFKTALAAKTAFKQAALFSPYSKDSVKKRVEAFEQVASSPKFDNETTGRVTRTKTRALAAANTQEERTPSSVAQKLARKSLAKAKKISLAKQARECDETKENETSNIPKPIKSSKYSMERPQRKQSKAHEQKLKTTPLGKNRMLQLPGSAVKNQFATPSNPQPHNAYTKPMTSSRNIVTHVDSFIQSSTKSAQKTIDRVAEEKRRRAHEEDARRKRDELLKAAAEEKRRKREEKELKNKLAREAKEKLEQEKRLKAEKEREEKAKLAQLMQEKQREEMEKKKLAQLLRAQEKEERRRQEELLRNQRLQEQDEQERILAEQKRREQEMEKRRLMQEMKMKNQMEKALMQAKAKAIAQKHMPTNYKMDSDPDEEESDDESKPKHEIPRWATKHVRQAQLAMQQFVPMRSVLRYFDSKKCTPDLRELFTGIDPKKLKRSSSAIWKTPPRFSMMNCSIIKD
ncbi:hypothetical protein TKK_0008703 [Trichogramma kaykai]